MFKKTIEYVNYNGEPRKKDHYFDLTKTELLELQLSEDGGITTFLRQVLMDQNGGKMISFTRKLILAAYGEKTPDGEYFMKNDEIRQRFACSPAFDILFTELTSSKEAGLEFMKGIMPKNLQKEIEEALKDENLAKEMADYMPTLAAPEV